VKAIKLRSLLSKSARAALVLPAVFSLTLISPLSAHAAVTNITPQAKVSFTFDDGLASAITQAAPTLSKYGLSATDYVVSGCIGMTKANNTCHANTDGIYMTWAQVTQLQSTYHWEIGSHTVTHPYLATSDATDGQPNVLTPAQVTTELTKSKSDLAAHGINATDFATPYGDYNNAVLAQIAKYYATQRGFGDIGTNVWPNSDYLLRVMQVQEGVTVAQVKAAVDQAAANNQWLILVMHDIKTKPSKNVDDYEYGTAELDQIASYVKTKQTAGAIQPININQGTVTSDVNLLPNPSFNSGISGGWTTDAPSNITADSGNNGSYPDPTNSVKMVATTKETHLFSPKVTVDPNTNYMLKNFLNVQTNTSGEVGFYVDEYDANGAWISGQYKAAERSSFVEEMNFAYKPTSANVASASLQVIVTANSGITAYLDNSQWFPLSSVTPPPAPQPTVITSATFDGGIINGWHTDSPTSIVADANNNGSPANPVNSVKMTATTANAHLFSPYVLVNSTKTYSLSTFVNIKQISSGEVGFYIDEYDANGNWISGQYKTGISALGTSTASFSYKPSSANVAQASLQIICVGNSNMVAYIDNVQWLLP
jgi:peptidoglycan/xylan/chitin deacetylase (PgdA/CDA1 family)